MHDLVALARTCVFMPMFYAGTLLWVLAALTASVTRPSAVKGVAVGWARYHRWLARWVLGQRIVVEGVLPSDARFVVVKHEAMFETVDILCLLDGPVIAAKRELLDLPLWGRAGRAYGLVPVDRSAGAAALRTLQQDAQAAMAAGRPMCLFPEGTRVPHGEHPPLRSGFAGLYLMLGLPVLPIAIDSGRVYPRRRFICYPGTIRYRVGEVVPPGLPRREAERRIHAAINALNTP